MGGGVQDDVAGMGRKAIWYGKDGFSLLGIPRACKPHGIAES